MIAMKTLYLFIDESGNLDFSPSGTKYYLLNVLSTTHPFGIGSPLLKLRYELLPNYACGPQMEDGGSFHASEDIQTVRNQVFSILTNTNHDLRIDSVIAQKNKTHPTLQKQEVEFYRTLGETALRYALSRVEWHGYDHVVMVFSSVFDRKKRGILKQAFKSLIKRHAGVPFALYFHDSKFDLCNQAVDYFGWAVYRKWEIGDARSYELVKSLVQSEFQIFEKGKTEYYPYKK
jgi:hypothetical protein